MPWLQAFEESGSIAPSTGWIARYLAVQDHGKILAFAPAYLKDHSQGDFLWDWQWASIAESSGIDYYPRLTATTPATPFGDWGPSFHEDLDQERRREIHSLLLEALLVEVHEGRVPGLHILFPATGEGIPQDMVSYVHHRYMLDLGIFKTFDDYLARFDKNQRRNIRRERQSIIDQGLNVEVLTGVRCLEQAEVMEAFYLETCEAFGPWGARFLEPGFFSRLLGKEGHQCVMFLARDSGGEAIGASFLVFQGERLWGRYWGSRGSWDNLHFELCYYRPIEWALGQGIRWFDPGLGGDHKVRRGFASVPSHSYHAFADPRLHRFFRQNLARLNLQVMAAIEEANRSIPWKSG